MYNIKRVLLHGLLLSSLALMPLSVLASETPNSINKEPAKKSEMVTKKVALNQNMQQSNKTGKTGPTVKKADWDDVGFGISIGRPYYYRPYYNYYPYRPYYYHNPYRYNYYRW